MDERNRVTRRDFLRWSGVASLAGAAVHVSTGPAVTQADANVVEVPTNPLGRTGVRVSRVSMGIDYDVGGSLLLLSLALRWGVTQWSTNCDYAGGNAETGIGRYFRKFPQDRARVHLATSCDGRDRAELLRLLDRSLERMCTDHVDLFLLHGVDDPRRLDDDVRRFATEQKALGRIRHVGFSTHANMARLLVASASLPWIDAALVKFNYRLMRDPDMVAAIEAFGRAGKGILAMKVLGDGPVRREDPDDMRLAGHFLERGFTPHQAAVKAVWENPWISAATLHADNTDALASFVKAAIDVTPLTTSDLDVLGDHADATLARFCAGCAWRCEGASGLPVSDVMRCLTYAGRPGQLARAREEFARLPPEVRHRLTTADLAVAESACPCGLAISDLVLEACRRLG